MFFNKGKELSMQIPPTRTARCACLAQKTGLLTARRAGLLCSVCIRHCQNRFHGVLWTPLYVDFSSTVEVHTVDKTKTYHYNASYGEHTGLNTASWQITLILILLKTSAASWKVLPLWHLQQVTPLPLLRNTFKKPTPITFPEVKVFHL